MSFDTNRCIMKNIYCGNGNIPNNKKNLYSKVGSPYECLKKGFGSGMYNEKKKTLSINSLQQISYVGDLMEQNFKNNGFNVIPHILINKDGKLNIKAYNSVLLFLHNNGIKNLPRCKIIN